MQRHRAERQALELDAEKSRGLHLLRESFRAWKLLDGFR
jgi:hypothetical protein